VALTPPKDEYKWKLTFFDLLHCTVQPKRGEYEVTVVRIEIYGKFLAHLGNTQKRELPKMMELLSKTDLRQYIAFSKI